MGWGSVAAVHHGAVAGHHAEITDVHFERQQIVLHMHSGKLGVQDAGITAEHHGSIPSTTLGFVAHGPAGDDCAGQRSPEDPCESRREDVRAGAGATSRDDVVTKVDVTVADRNHFGHGHGVAFRQARESDDIVSGCAAHMLVVVVDRRELLTGPAERHPFGLREDRVVVFPSKIPRCFRLGPASRFELTRIFRIGTNQLVSSSTDDDVPFERPAGAGRFGLGGTAADVDAGRVPRLGGGSALALGNRVVHARGRAGRSLRSGGADHGRFEVLSGRLRGHQRKREGSPRAQKILLGHGKLPWLNPFLTIRSGKNGLIPIYYYKPY